MTLCRQGVDLRFGVHSMSQALVSWPDRLTSRIRIGYFGRLDATKGVDLLIKAIRLAPDARARLDIYGVNQVAPTISLRGSIDWLRATDEWLLGRRAQSSCRRQGNAACSLVPCRHAGLKPGRCGGAGSLCGGDAGATRLGGRAGHRRREQRAVAARQSPERWAREIARMAHPARLLRLLKGSAVHVRWPTAQDMASLYRTMLGEGKN